MPLSDKLDGYALLITLAFLASTWVPIFIVRLILAPEKLLHEIESEINRMKALEPKKHKNSIISGVQLVPSGDKMCLVITPKIGGKVVRIFADVAHHNSGSRLDELGWPYGERYYLGRVKLVAENLKFSVDVMKSGPKEAPPQLRGWLWSLIDPQNDKENGALPCFMFGKERVTFSFMDDIGVTDRFQMLLVRPKDCAPSIHPIVLTLEDMSKSA
ncbi:hypothetical protein HNR60_002269 [Rhodopseudomonas rhenobacensis]|uniref:Uncharacterized protein n=1 Tax=Rhodopseudomonas rhenobacensis TaxID=87461 RepID=A0A7W7Z3T5_9BRAD|nr:hypothetical protein [Rhodopseudomonas rhenobacensis]MBB5047512.1 hypothetical protein [Rhodopseudomonas rhenobacensis]